MSQRRSTGGVHPGEPVRCLTTTGAVLTYAQHRETTDSEYRMQVGPRPLDEACGIEFERASWRFTQIMRLPFATHSSSIFHCSRSSTGRGSLPSSHSTQLSGVNDGSVDSITHDRNSTPPFKYGGGETGI